MRIGFIIALKLPLLCENRADWIRQNGQSH